jgi:hypothetical protein
MSVRLKAVLLGLLFHLVSARLPTGRRYTTLNPFPFFRIACSSTIGRAYFRTALNIEKAEALETHGVFYPKQLLLKYVVSLKSFDRFDATNGYGIRPDEPTQASVIQNDRFQFYRF